MKSICIVALFVATAVAAPSYGHHGKHYEAVVHTYPVKAPVVKCGASLLVGCAPQVGKVPCKPGHKQEYGHAAPAHYAPAPAHHYAPAPAPSYHAASYHRAMADDMGESGEMGNMGGMGGMGGMAGKGEEKDQDKQ